jgi:hypothetical protein
MSRIGDDGKIGLWELGGSSLLQDDMILLVPPIQYRKGCLWTDAEIPSIDVWQMSLTFRISHAEGGSFGVWFVGEYAQEGTFCGGPNVFRGAALVGQVQRTRGHNYGLKLKFIQNTGKDQYNEFDMTPDAYVEMPSREDFKLTIRFDKGTFKVFDDGSEPILEKEITVNLKDNYIGISAQNDHLPMKFELHKLQFNLNVRETGDSKRKRSMGNKKPSPHFTPSKIYRLRNPAYNKTIKEIQLQEESNGELTKEVTAEEIFDIIDEVNRANFDVASFSELNAFIRTNIMNYSQKWQRRTVKLVDRVRNTRNVAGAAMNYTTTMMEAFREQMQHTLSKTNEKLIDFYSLFGEIGSRGIDVNNDMQQIADDINNRSIVTWLIYAAVAEIVGIVLLLIAANTCMKSRVYGRSFSM